MKGDLLGIIEAAYQPVADESDWLACLLAAATPVLDAGLGVYAHTYTLRPDGSVCLPTIRTMRGPASRAFCAAAERLMRPFRDVLPNFYPRAPTVGFGTQLAGTPTWRFAELEPRANDVLGIAGGNLSGHGVVLHNCVTEVGRLTAADTRLWMHVAAHLAAGSRLRLAAPVVDAVLTPQGRVEHAEGDAREGAKRACLGVAARAIDRARGRLRRADPTEALALWQSLVEGQWSLVEQIDSDGRRFLFARRNAPQTRPWGDLSERERQVVAYASEGQAHKMIAYELGIGVSTVSTHLRNAARKVGARSRLELVGLYKRTGERSDAHVRRGDPSPLPKEISPSRTRSA